MAFLSGRVEEFLGEEGFFSPKKNVINDCAIDLSWICRLIMALMSWDIRSCA